MKAAMVTGAKKMEMVDVEKPVADGKKVIIKPTCVGICGSDIHLWEMGMLPQYTNMIMGHEHAGVVVDPGSRTDLKVGDRVTQLPLWGPCGECVDCMEGRRHLCKNRVLPTGTYAVSPGSYAEYFTSVPSLVRKIPEGMTDAEAAMIEPASTPYAALKDVGIKKGDKVLVAGGGIIGSFAAQWAKYFGAELVAMSEVNDFRMKTNNELGYVDIMFDARDPECIKKMMTATGGAGWDYVIECTGNDAAMQSALMTMKKRGTIVILGIAVKGYTLPGLLTVAKCATLKAYLGYSESEFDEVMELVANKKFDVLPQYTSDCKLSEVESKFEWLQSPKCTDVKIMITDFEN